MITHEEIINYCNYLITKDQIGDPISPIEYSSIISIVNIEVFNREKKRLIELSMGDHYKFIELLRDSYLQDTKRTLTVETELRELTLDKNVDMLLTCTAFCNGAIKKVSIVSEGKASDMDSGLWDSEDVPYVYTIGNVLYFSQKVSQIKIIYLRLPEKPIYDYFITSDKFLHYYLPPDYKVVLQNGQYNVLSGAGKMYFTNIEHPKIDGYISKSIEFGWKESMLDIVVNLIFEKMGISMRESIPIQIAQTKKQDV